jgi:hypothetical protein
LKEQKASLKKILQPYLLISVAGLLAFAPVSFMLKALKNDIVALEYPINHFISQCIHNGKLPYWFNTWGMGFPLQSNLTWGIFSTPQLLFSSIFDYNIYILHIEFMFFVLLAGWSMFHLLNKYFVKDEKIAQLLAICYMLSGFMVGSTQWLLYITAASFIPLIICSLLNLLHTPSFKNALQFAIMYTLMFTSVYAAFNIITTYSLIIFLLIWFGISKKEKETKTVILWYIILAGGLTFLLCLPCLYYTFELLTHIERGNSITTDTAFFSSNYLHPAALSNMLFPFTSVKSDFPNTEGTMLNTYAGLFVVIFLPVAFWQMLKEKNKAALLMFGAALLFIVIAFGSIAPFRNLLNILPGFSYFRNPAIFRLYFITSLILFLGILFRNVSFAELLSFKNNQKAKIVHYTIWILIIVCFIVLLVNINKLGSLSFSSLTELIKNISWHQTLLISAFLQSIILIILLLAAKAKHFGIANFILTLDLIINTLLCTPFFSVSSYSIPEVNKILHSIPGFPLQNKKISDVATTYTDKKMNVWNNVNIFSKQVSSNNSYRGPLNLKHSYLFTSDSIRLKSLFDKPLIFVETDTTAGTVKLLIQEPTHVQASVNIIKPTLVTLMQNYYPGWKAYYNKNETKIVTTNKPGITVSLPEGKGIIDFRYEKKGVWLSALLLHLITIIFFLWKGYELIKRKLLKSPSPS